jgi:hypothetical protein
MLVRFAKAEVDNNVTPKRVWKLLRSQSAAVIRPWVPAGALSA